MRAMHGALSAALLAAVLCVSSLRGACGALLAVDYGSEWLKASLVAPGRAPISIVLNEASKRKSAAAVAFSAGERTLGDDAAALAGRYPERVFLRARDLLGRPAGGAALGAALAAAYSPHAPAPVPGRGTVALPAHGGGVPDAPANFTAEELAASVLSYARACAEAQAGSAIRDAVVTVPPFWSQAQRAALLDAAALAGLNVLSLVSEPAAAATQFGIDRDPPANNGTELVVIYDMGAGSASAALVAYSGWRVREAGKPKTYTQFELKAVAWEDGAGGEALDLALAGARRQRAGRARGARGAWAAPCAAGPEGFAVAARSAGARSAGPGAAMRRSPRRTRAPRAHHAPIRPAAPRPQPPRAPLAPGPRKPPPSDATGPFPCIPPRSALCRRGERQDRRRRGCAHQPQEHGQAAASVQAHERDSVR
jgi:hypothetical protein